MDVVENWKDFRHAEGILDVDLLLLWCDNVYRNLHDVWQDAKQGTGEGIYSRSCPARERNLRNLQMIMARMSALKCIAVYWTREVRIEERWSSKVLLLLLSKQAEVWSTDSRQLSEEDLQWWEHYRLDDKPELPSDCCSLGAVRLCKCWSGQSQATSSLFIVMSTHLT
ncbi:hypothetical protein RI054_08g42540 [Pseudoscourfieldia marina]